MDLGQFRYAGTNLTAFRLVDPANPAVRDTMADWNMRERSGILQFYYNLHTDTIFTS